MAVDALELRPRNAIAIFDAAVHLCASTFAVWSLTLPSSALLVAALFFTVESAQGHRPLFLPVASFTCAWVLRSISQGAACHSIEQHVLGNTAPSTRASMWAALQRAPSLVIASAWMAAFNAMLLVFTLGIGFLFLGAHAVGYAATMHGQGHMFNVYQTCSKLLGPSRHVAVWVRFCGLSQFIFGLNLHLMTQLCLVLATSLFGLEVSFLSRFAAFDNPTWLFTLAGLTFALFEPIRAAAAALLLIDGRVRQEGLDLVAQVQQLPPRKTSRAAAVALALVALPAFAESALLERTSKVIDACDMTLDSEPLLTRVIPDDEQSAFSRFITRVEHKAYEEDDCEGAEADLGEGLQLYAELGDGSSPIAIADIKTILARPEFETATADENEPDVQKSDDTSLTWFEKLSRWLRHWLDEQEASKPKPSNNTHTAGETVATIVMLGAVILIIGILVFVLSRLGEKGSKAAIEDSLTSASQALESDAHNALSKQPETWAQLADALAAKGAYREAIRHLYLALLSKLHRDGAINYVTSLSNWEYLFAFNGASSIKTIFHELTSHFDFAWYGNLGIDAAAYAHFRGTAAPLLASHTERAP